MSIAKVIGPWARAASAPPWNRSVAAASTAMTAGPRTVTAVFIALLSAVARGLPVLTLAPRPRTLDVYWGAQGVVVRVAVAGGGHRCCGDVVHRRRRGSEAVGCRSEDAELEPEEAGIDEGETRRHQVHHAVVDGLRRRRTLDVDVELSGEVGLDAVHDGRVL